MFRMKNIANFVQSENIPDLLCVTCNRVLSQFPVYCYKGGSTCGRCPYPENGIRNEAYEVLAQNIKFPCNFNKDGCLENLYPKDVAEHEKMCRFRKYNCPAISNAACEWRGFAKNILDHFEKKHQMLILDENFFEIDFVNDHNVNYLFPYGEGLYLVNRRTDSKKHMFICTVSHLGHDPFEGCASYRIILESGNKSSSHVVSDKVNNTVHINRDVLNSVLNNPLVIVAKIEILEENQEISCDDEDDDEETNPNINYELLQELECMVCLEYMVPPIHQCITGHSICLSCKEAVTECPSCKKEFQNTQNFALAQIIQHIDYPCKNSKCKFSAKPKDIKLHQATCIYSPYACPLKDYLKIPCETEMLFEDLYDHIQEFHYENLLEMDTASIPFYKDDEDNLENKIDDCFIIKHNSLLFKLDFIYFEKEFAFAVHLIGPSEDSIKYNFEIDILSCSGNDYRALMSKSCGPMTDWESAFNNSNYVVNFSFKQIKQFISDQLCFRVRISNN